MKETAKTAQLTKATHDTQADLNKASKIGLGMVLSFAGLIGAWGVACMIAALSSQGIGGVVKGFLTAITGM